MTRDELRQIIEGISDEQLKSILDINSADIGKAKSGNESLVAQLDEAKATISGFEEQIAALRESLGEAEKQREEFEALKKSVLEREASDLAKKQEEELKVRFTTAAEDARFLNEYTQNGIFREFCSALAQPLNQGKTDAEVYEEIIAGKGNLFIPNDAEIPSVVSVSGGLPKDFDDGDIREIMGLSR